MLINGKADEITKDDFMKVAEFAGIKKLKQKNVSNRVKLQFHRRSVWQNPSQILSRLQLRNTVYIPV